MIKPAKLIKLVNSIIVLLKGKCCFYHLYPRTVSSHNFE